MEAEMTDEEKMQLQRLERQAAMVEGLLLTLPPDKFREAKDELDEIRDKIEVLKAASTKPRLVN
jgi:hypothetical protein